MDKLNLSLNRIESDRSGSEKSQCVSCEEDADAALRMLEAITPRTWKTPQDRTLFVARLMRSPTWKLLKLDEYNGPINGGVFQYLDQIHLAPESAYEAIGYSQKIIDYPQDMNIARDMNLHIQEITGVEFKSSVLHDQDPVKYAAEKSAWVKRIRASEFDSLKKLDAKYPRLGLNRILGDNRFVGV